MAIILKILRIYVVYIFSTFKDLSLTEKATKFHVQCNENRKYAQFGDGIFI